jgi:hypothetical protein
MTFQLGYIYNEIFYKTHLKGNIHFTIGKLYIRILNVKNAKKMLKKCYILALKYFISYLKFSVFLRRR